MYFRSVRKISTKVHEYTYMQHLLEGGVYFIQLLTHGRRLLEGGIYWRAGFIGVNMVVFQSLQFLRPANICFLLQA